ncbi:MAG: polysaccharide pyruvyl transferase family protein [Lachnospiraceae bacterium]|nr:polysaccharide pyruvyl transferase family protein [Lachnospiraceae bacterium]
MKTIGILTFHYADNYGAVLQTYALRRTINSLSGCRAEIINYVPSGFSIPLYQNSEECRQRLLEKRKKFERFLQERCGLTDVILQEVSEKQFDYYCVGSDQVWNLNFADEEYLLPNLSDEVMRFSYAASVGMSLEEAYLKKDIFKKHLSKFKMISLREDVHVEFFSKLCGKECCKVLDPTLLLDANEWNDMVTKESKCENPYLLFFWILHDDELLKGVELANTISRKYNLSIIHTIVGAKSYMFNNDAGCILYEGVEDFLWYVKNARFVVTNSYHAMLFSIQFKTAFYTFVVQSMRSRIDSVIEMFDISNRIVNNYINAGQINYEIDWESIEAVIRIEREKSMKFIKDALDIRE